MDKDLKLIFRDLQEEGFIQELRSKKKRKEARLVNHIKRDVDRVRIGNDPMPFIVKHSNVPKGLVSVASSKMYRDVGILTPEVHLLKTENVKVANTIQQDLTAVEDIDMILAGSDLEYEKIEQSVYGHFKWKLFYEKDLENLFLQFMTPECLEQLKNIFLSDEVRTDVDRHAKNYFFYKQKGSDKYEGVIAIDLDQMIIYSYNIRSKRDFENFLFSPYETETPQMRTDEVCYKQRIEDIRDLVQDGVLNDGNIETLRNVLNYDFPKQVRKVSKSQGLWGKNKKRVVDPIERLWDYNNQTLGKDLGL